MNNENIKRIDTSKYEVHTEGPWWINHEDGDGATSIWNGTIDEGNMNHVADVDAHKNDLKLIAKVPEILAELKIMYEGVDALIAELEIINNRETKNEVDGNLIVDYLKRL